MIRTTPVREASSLERFLIPLTVLVTTFFFSAGSKESFREPKEICFHIAVFILISTHAILWARGSTRLIVRTHPRVLRVVLLILAWTLVCAVASTNVGLSRPAFVHIVLAASFLYLAVATATRVAAGRELSFIGLLTVPNAVVGILQRHGVWSPFPLEDLGHRLTVVGFLGNPNDLGGFLVPCALVHLALTLSTSMKLRVLNGFCFLLSAYAIAATESATAIAALLICSLTVAFLILESRTKRLIAALLVLVVVAGIAVPVIAWQQAHLREKLDAWREGGVAAFFGNRSLAYSAAWILAREHPLTGVGPGTFGWHYLRSVLQARQENPSLPFYAWAHGIFQETHSDFLEILAETGFPGLGLAVIAVGVFLFGLGPRAPEKGGVPFSIATLRVPLAISLVIQMAVNFPLQITAIMVLYVYLAAQVIACHVTEESA